MTPKQLRDTLERLHLTQTAAAHQLGVHPRTVSKWIRGERRIPEPVAIILRQWSIGDPLTILVQQARAALNSSREGAMRLAAALAAVAFETAIRRVGVVAGVKDRYVPTEDRKPLREVIDSIDRAGVLGAAEVYVAYEYLNFRNHALNAHTKEIDRAAVRRVLGFVEQLQRFR